MPKTTIVKKERLRKWVKLLRTTKRKQARGHLYDRRNGVDSCCCLGIGCMVYKKETGKGKWIDDDVVSNIHSFVTDSAYYHNLNMPMHVSKWFGLISQNDLVTLNDLKNKSFKEI